MIGRLWALGVASSVLLFGCVRENDEEFRALLVVLDAVAENIPDSVSVCVANRYLTSADSVLPPDLQQKLRHEGWHLFDPMVGESPADRRAVPPNPGESMMILGHPKLEEGSWLVPVSYTLTDRRSEYVSWAMFDATHRVRCTRGECEVVEAVGHGHGDGGMPAAAFDGYERPRCGTPRGPSY